MAGALYSHSQCNAMTLGAPGEEKVEQIVRWPRACACLCLPERVGVNWSTGGAEREAAEPGVLYIPRPPGHAERKNGHEQVANF